MTIPANVASHCTSDIRPPGKRRRRPTIRVAASAPLFNFLGGSVVATWLDPEISGYRRDRPGLKGLLAAVEAGEVDLIVCGSLDRLARDAEDVA